MLTAEKAREAPFAAVAPLSTLASAPYEQADDTEKPDDAQSLAQAPDQGSTPIPVLARDDEKEDKKSQASAIVGFVRERAELFHDENRDAYAQDLDGGEVRRLDGCGFREWLSARFFEETKRSVGDRAMGEAISTLTGLAVYGGRRHAVHVRIARHDGAYYLDLGATGNSRAVKIVPRHWEIVERPPVRFVRSQMLAALPDPQRDGRVGDLWQFVNVPENCRVLVLAWLVECLRPETPFPVLELMGEQGSAKSTTQRFLRRLIDPSTCELRAVPRSVEDVFIGAQANLVTSFENVSNLSVPMQDACCVIATGGSHVTRKYYTNGDEYAITVKRPIAINGVVPVVTQQDLVDRTVAIETPRIGARVPLDKLTLRFDKEHGRLLGALLTLMAQALAALPSVEIPAHERPRLLEYAELGEAITRVMGVRAGDFLCRFRENRREAIGRTIDSNPVAEALMEWFEANGRQKAVMTSKELLFALQAHKREGGAGLPKEAKAFSDLLRRAKPALREHNISVSDLGRKRDGYTFEISDLDEASNCERRERGEHPPTLPAPKGSVRTPGGAAHA